MPSVAELPGHIQEGRLLGVVLGSLEGTHLVAAGRDNSKRLEDIRGTVAGDDRRSSHLAGLAADTAQLWDQTALEEEGDSQEDAPAGLRAAGSRLLHQAMHIEDLVDNHGLMEAEAHHNHCLEGHG